MSTQLSPVYPPSNRSVLLSDLPDFNLKHNALLPAFVYSPAPGSVTEISHLEFARAVHRSAHALRASSSLDGQVVAVIAKTDTLLYQALIAGMLRSGLVPFPISPRNSAEAVISMLQKTSCHRILTTHASLSPLMTEIASVIDKEYTLSIEEIPTLAQIFPRLGSEVVNDPFVPYPAPNPLRALDDIVMYIHSSGSTGFPKPIKQTNEIILEWCYMPGVSDLKQIGGRVAAMHLPPFHSMGLLVQLLAPLFDLLPICLYPPTSFENHAEPPMMPTSDSIVEHSKRTKATLCVTVPTFIELWNPVPDHVEWLKSLTHVIFGGGPLSPQIGDALTRAGVCIRSLYGATEFGVPAVLESTGKKPLRAPEDWNYVSFSEMAKPRWVHQGDGTFELQFLTTETHQPSVENLPDVKGYATNDTWEPHPTKEGLWKIVGRVDDVIVLASGEKAVPAPMENVIMSSSLVNGVVMFGRQRNQVGTIIEPRVSADFNDITSFRNKIWPVIEEANKTSPAFSRIFKEMIIFTNPDKPMERAAKGTVLRKPTLNAYEKEITELYEIVEASTKESEKVEPPKNWLQGDLQQWLIKHVMDIMSTQSVDPQVDLFEQGFDSLSATFLRNRIIGALRSSSDANAQGAAQGLPQNVIFSHPTLSSLAETLSSLVLSDKCADTDLIASAKVAIEEMIKKYSTKQDHLSQHLSSSNTNDSRTGVVVLLTGSTGGLGSFLLESLLKDTSVTKVYAYNRPSRGGLRILDRQIDAFEDRMLDTALLSSEKLAFVEGDSALDHLGLEASLYEQIRTSTNLIIHNAWRLDFNLSLSSFEPNVRGTHNLINLALSSPRPSAVRLLFTSSIATAQSWDKLTGAFPEEVQYDAGVAAGAGYGESKYVAERLLADSGLHGTSFRIGQLTGGLPDGAWSTTDWVPSLIKSSLKLGALPDAQGLVSFLPMQAVSNAILDVAFSQEQPSIAVNLVHPQPITWSSMISAIGDALMRENVTSTPLPLLPFPQWFQRLEERAHTATGEDLIEIPAIKLLEFFRAFSSGDEAIRESGRVDLESGALPNLSTEKARAASQTMRDLAPIGDEDAQRWIDYWVTKGLLTRGSF